GGRDVADRYRLLPGSGADWSSQGRTGTVRIDDRGRPFRTTGIGSLPRYVYETSERAWVPYT
ncbi:hypothetical protein ACWDRX_31505, partial [Streptomyces nigra]